MIGVELATEIPIEEVASLAADAEDAGFDAVFASCHYNNRDPFVALDRIAAATDAASVGPAAANPYEVHPVRLASQVATLQEVADGRAVFGVGAGDRSTLGNLGIDRDRPLRRVLETFRIARRLWAGERVHHEGAFVARDAGLNFEVPAPPVYVAAQGPGMLRMSGKHADGVLVNAAHPREVAWAADRVAEGLADRSAARERDADAFDVAAYGVVSVAEDGDAARAAARIPVAFVAAGAAPETLDRHGVNPDRAAEVGDAVESGAFREAADAVTEAMLDGFAIAGTPEEVAAGIEDVLGYADSFVAASPLGPDTGAAIRLLGAALDRDSRA